MATDDAIRPPRWSAAPPTGPGWYWHHGPGRWAVAMAQVVGFETPAGAVSNYAHLPGGWTAVDKLPTGTRWAGPLAPPEEAAGE